MKYLTMSQTTTLRYNGKAVTVPSKIAWEVRTAWNHLQICQAGEYACRTAEEAVAFLRACHHKVRAARFAAALCF